MGPAASSAAAQSVVTHPQPSHNPIDLEFLLDYPAGLIFSEEEEVYLYWYGKKEGRPGRKMGHVTCLGAKRQESRARTLKFIEQLRQKSKGAAA